MTDYDRTLKPGEMQIARFPPKDGKWKRRGEILLAEGDTVRLTAGEVAPPPDEPPPDEPPPDQPPPDQPPATSQLLGFGKDTVGGNGGDPMKPTTLNDLIAALRSTSKADVVWSGGTSPMRLSADLGVVGSKTVDLKGLVIYGRALRPDKGCKQLIVRNGRFRAGSLGGYWEDALNAGDYSGSLVSENHVYDHCEFAWAGDVNAVMLGRARKITWQFCAFYEPLFQSFHDESYPADADGHALNLNLVGAPASDGTPAEYTVIYSLIAYGQGRNWRIGGVDKAELLNSLLVDCHEPPMGSPRSARVEGNVFLRPGSWDFLPKAYGNDIFQHQPTGKFDQNIAGAVFCADNRAEGYTLTYPSITTQDPAKAKFARSEATLKPSAEVEAFVLANVGAVTRDAYMATLVDDVKNRRQRKPMFGKDVWPPVARLP